MRYFGFSQPASSWDNVTHPAAMSMRRWARMLMWQGPVPGRLRNEGELRRQATAAGVFLELGQAWRPIHEVVPPVGQKLVPAPIHPPLTRDETESLLVWLDGWQERPSLDPPGPVEATETTEGSSGFELARRSWCPRCQRAGDPWGDPLGKPAERFRCEVVPPAPLLEVGPPHQGAWMPAGEDPHLHGWWWDCGTRRLYRWGLKRKAVDPPYKPFVDALLAEVQTGQSVPQPLTILDPGEALIEGAADAAGVPMSRITREAAMDDEPGDVRFGFSGMTVEQEEAARRWIEDRLSPIARLAVTTSRTVSERQAQRWFVEPEIWD